MGKDVVASLRRGAIWIRRLPQATSLMFTARSPLGRSTKIFLFGVGVVMPLGSLIWMLLFWHGNSIDKQKFSLLPAKQNQALHCRTANSPAVPK
jgi:hypothetical protein